MKIKVVTGYIPLPVLNCSPTRFHECGDQLAEVCDDAGVPMRGFSNEIDECWAFKFIASLGRNIKSQWPVLPADRFVRDYDAVCSDIVMHQKYEWLALAAIEDPGPDVFIWIDYGVMKQVDMTMLAITEFLHRVADKKVIDEIEAPGIRQIMEIDDSQSWDRFCGSVVIVPRHRLFDLCRAMKQHCMGFITKSGKITIESNTLAHIEAETLIPFRWYPSWWGASMFTSYK